MNKTAFLRMTDCFSMTAKALGVVGMLGVWALTSQAAETSSSFRVTVNQPENPVPDDGLCRFIGAFGTSVTVTCFPGIRFITQPPAFDKLQDAEISYTGAGTVTSWRMIRFDNGDYLEMTVRW